MGGHSKIDLLILGAGWTSTFLIPLCQHQGISYVATSRAGREGTLPFLFDPESENPDAYKRLPLAKSILITFPITIRGASERLVRLYKATHGGDAVQFIQLGTTSIWGVSVILSACAPGQCGDSKSREAQRASLSGMTDTQPLIRITNERWRSKSCWHCLPRFLRPCLILQVSGAENAL